MELKQPKPFGPVTVTGLGPPVGMVNVKPKDAGALVVVVDELEDDDDVLDDVVVPAPAAWLIVAVVKSPGLLELRTTSVHVRAGEPTGFVCRM